MRPTDRLIHAITQITPMLCIGMAAKIGDPVAAVALVIMAFMCLFLTAPDPEEP